MNKARKKWLIIAAILTISGLVIFAGAMAALDFDFLKLSTTKYETKTYEVEGNFDKISIDENVADIVFENSNDESCKVVCSEAEKIRHSVAVKNGTLIIGIEDDRKWYDYIGVSFGNSKMTVYLPQSEYASLFINTDTGNVDIPKHFTFNELNFKSDTGNMDCLANISDTIKIESDTGNIDISSVVSKCSINIKTSTGSIKLTDVECTNFTAGSDTGNIFLVNVVAADSFNMESDTGNVKLKGSDAANLSIKTDTGNIIGTLLSEKVFIAGSSTGKVEVPKTVTGGKCEIITDTGNIIIDIQ